MIEREIDIETADGSMNTFLVHPAQDGPYPVILFLMDAGGKREELHDMARRLATAGYLVALPNLYYRRVREFIASADNRHEMKQYMQSLTNAMVCADCLALAEKLQPHAMADGGAIGCVGYCMSGTFAFALASALPDRVAAAASIHGIKLFHTGSQSPHHHAHRIRGELYFACAERDDWAPWDMINGLDSYLSNENCRYQIEWYPETEHGFVFPNRPAYRKVAAEHHWEQLLALFRRNLPSDKLN